jgi:hypothetical protein
MALVAATCVNPTTFGTLTGAGPDDTTRVTPLPAATDVPAAGLSLMTDPIGTVPLAAVLTAPTVSPAAVMALVAATCVNPTTFGTLIDAGPDDTTRVTPLPAATDVPAAGLSLMTRPATTVALGAEVTVPSVSPATVIALAAAACVCPTTFGTFTGA